MKSLHPPPADSDFDTDSFSLMPFWMDIWEKRWLIGVVLLVVSLIYVGVAARQFLAAPTDVTAQVELRLVFDGADRGQYPNGTPFVRSDLISTPVLTEVYRINDLERYLPFERFRDSVFVMESNQALELLGYQYEARLADTRMNAVERSRIETEFKQKLESQSVPQLFLRFMLSGRQTSIPRPVLEKVLNDILSVWAQQVTTQKGSLLYQLDLLTPNIIRQDTLNTQTSLIRYDLLRRHVGRARTQLAKVEALPGADTIRVGEDKLSLSDLQTNLVDLLEFHLNPLIRRRLIYALSPAEAQLNVLYLEDRMLELEGIRQTADTRRTQLQAALQTFTADSATRTGGTDAGAGSISTQLSDSFLDRLIDIGGESGAIQYRKELTDRIIDAGEQGLRVDQDIAFYRESLRLLREAMRGVRPAALQPENVNEVFEAIQGRVVEALTLTGEAYEKLSGANLNARGALFTLVGPYSVRTVTTVSVRNLALGWLGVLILSLVFVCAAVVARGIWRRRLPQKSRGRVSGGEAA